MRAFAGAPAYDRGRSKEDMMKTYRIGTNPDGSKSICRAKPENVGKGRCHHTSHETMTSAQWAGARESATAPTKPPATLTKTPTSPSGGRRGDVNRHHDPVVAASAKTVIDITSASGRPVTASITYRDTMVDDTFDGEVIGRKHSVYGEVVLTSEGKRIGSAYIDDTGATRCYPTTYQQYHGYVYGRVLVSEQGHLALDKAIADAADKGTSREVKSERARKERERHAGIVAAARRDIAKAEAQHDIPDESVAAERLRRYNDLHNEGGDGWLPSLITRERYEEARRIVERDRYEKENGLIDPLANAVADGDSPAA
jgi:hypothetical protein